MKLRARLPPTGISVIGKLCRVDSRYLEPTTKQKQRALGGAPCHGRRYTQTPSVTVSNSDGGGGGSERISVSRAGRLSTDTQDASIRDSGFSAN